MLLSATPETALESPLSLEEATHVSKLAYSTLRKKIGTGELKAERIGRRVYVRREDLEALAQPVTGRPTTEAAIETAIDRLVAAAPRLTDSHRQRLAPLMAGGLR
ncbi:hypothetical protein AQ436_10585 [Arthrobacter sp. EpRS66]|nr:hypothetical protein AQ436_10585 [Arthrobacter sp. EpRS66]